MQFYSLFKFRSITSWFWSNQKCVIIIILKMSSLSDHWVTALVWSGCVWAPQNNLLSKKILFIKKFKWRRDFYVPSKFDQQEFANKYRWFFSVAILPLLQLRYCWKSIIRDLRGKQYNITRLVIVYESFAVYI